MHKLRTIIVDDEPLALNLLRAKLKKIETIEIVAECKNGREAISAAMDHEPDLMFLDIQMPGIDGFGVIKKLQTDIMPLVVFTTAFERYALDAFDVHAVDYILKPVDGERIERAVERVAKRLELEGEQNRKQQIISAMDSFKATEEKAQQDAETSILDTPVNHAQRKVIIKDRDDITLLKQSEIEWIDAAGDYVCIHVNGVTHIKRSTLKSMLNELDPSIFKRVHRSTIVNLNFIEKVIPHTKGEFYLMLGEYDKVKVSRNYRDVIKSFLSDS